MPGKKKVIAPPPDRLMKELARRGPHKVDRGDLGIVGLAGQVFAPRTGKDLPGVAFAHSWLRGSRHYRDLMFHLASWGIVVAAPDSERGPLASDVELATDLRAALTVLQSVRLGAPGQIGVDPERIAVAGHGFGAAAAVRAAGSQALLGRPQIPVRAVIGLFPAPTTSSLLDAAASVTAPSLIVAAADEMDSMIGNAVPLAKALGGDVVLRTLAGVDGRALLENPSIKSLIGINGAERKVHAAVRAQVTGYLLHTLTGDERYAAFADPEADMGAVTAVDVATARRADVDHVSQLLGIPAYKADDDEDGKRKKGPAALAR
ncbi:alpha/beta hydrolase [Gordonia sp. PP30]|uniref:poly(ethylene terephthalate) hydrolase family protein n=1 Tax=unclassified Gordonia (in: high G+C Gram-positive bacteria) TaxID=2657482 RepID=UPI001FFED15C|nr:MULTISPECIES: alpha/beta hydrolase [unclassified Gordonia (in: high G+C Gram-positive bacteria)]UQE76105.1 alpha/beta hydrolase [Gordonia sp. PP30]